MVPNRPNACRCFTRRPTTKKISYALQQATSDSRLSQRIRSEGSATVVDAAFAADVARVVQESVAMIY